MLADQNYSTVDLGEDGGVATEVPGLNAAKTVVLAVRIVLLAILYVVL